MFWYIEVVLKKLVLHPCGFNGLYDAYLGIEKRARTRPNKRIGFIEVQEQGRCIHTVVGPGPMLRCCKVNYRLETLAIYKFEFILL